APPTDLDGQVSDKESQATSTTPPLDYRPGQPLAREGLEIATRRPKFSRLTKLTARARDPVVEFWFQKDGTVKKAALVVKSGDERVDEDVLNAAYNWTASGAALADLKGDAHVSVRVRFAL
ncbi:MAG: energy transducer TonB, partial [Phycisphaerales bacterium]|nr:energy transducer TonB [Phycisphaerales bacterium]